VDNSDFLAMQEPYNYSNKISNDSIRRVSLACSCHASDLLELPCDGKYRTKPGGGLPLHPEAAGVSDPQTQ
jgi:hypothetical protein